MSAITGPNSNTSGLVLSLDAASQRSYTSGSLVWYDVSGNGNNGTLVSGSGYSPINGGAITFNGVNNYVDCPSTNFNSISAFAFIRPEQRTGTNYPHIVAKWFIITSPLQNLRSWDLAIESTTGRLYSSISTDGTFIATTVKQYFSVSTIAYQQWQQVGMTFNNGSFNLYINGQIISVTKPYDANITTIYNSNITTKIGDSTDGSFDFKYSGSIADVQIYNRALSPDEIQQNFNSQRFRFGI